MTVPLARAMSFAVSRLAGTAGAGRWRWMGYSHPDRILPRGGTIVGDRDKAERAGRAATASMGGTLLVEYRRARGSTVESRDLTGREATPAR